MILASDQPRTDIYSLPNEILGEIFLACTDSLPEVDPHRAPLVFTRISHRFRSVALTTPILWSNICIQSVAEELHRHLKYRHTRKYSAPGYAAAVSEWLLLRSGERPLNITVVGAIGWKRPALLKVLFACAARWQDITLVVADASPLPQLAALNETDVPLLRSLSITHLNRSQPPFKTSRLFLAPRLQKVELSVKAPFTLHADMSWANLIHINLSNFDGPFPKLLAQTTRLQFLCINAKSFERKIVLKAIDLPHLTTLEITGYWNKGLSYLLEHLTTPSLEVLRVTPHNIRGACLADFVRRIPRLRTLDVWEINHASLLDILRSCPELKELKTALTPRPTAQESTELLDALSLCSELEVVHCSNALRPDGDAIRRLYERKKRDGVSAWKRFSVGFAIQTAVDLLSELTSNADRGIWNFWYDEQLARYGDRHDDDDDDEYDEDEDEDEYDDDEEEEDEEEWEDE